MSKKVIVANLKPVPKWKMLGAGVNGGRRRSVAFFREGLKTARERVSRVRQLRKLGVRTTPMVGVGVTSVQSYGWGTMGMSDTMLEQARQAWGRFPGMYGNRSHGQSLPLVLKNKMFAESLIFETYPHTVSFGLAKFVFRNMLFHKSSVVAPTKKAP